MHDKLGVEAAIHDVSTAHMAEEGLLSWFRSEWLVDPRPLAADVWVFSLNLSYWTTADPATELQPEDGQPARWVDVCSDWRTFHRPDAAVIARFAEQQSTFGSHDWSNLDR